LGITKVRKFTTALFFDESSSFINFITFIISDRFSSYRVIEDLMLASVNDTRILSPELGIGDRYFPLPYLTLQLNYAFGTLTPFSYLAVNLALHLCVCLSMIPMVESLGCDAGYGQMVGPLAALLMAAHPANTHAIASLEARGELLQTLFIVGAMIARGQGTSVAVFAACFCRC